MIVHVARRGHSFKGAGLYYLHDKGASTTERVEWTHTHNLPTDDPDKALMWMAYTTKSSDRLKTEAGVAMTGRKASAGCVYAFALSWHPEQKPEKEHMLNAAFTTLERLGLKEHEAVMVAHQDTDHPHVHVICNLVNPKDGRTAVPSYDRLSLSKWAEEYEKEDGKIYCEERVKNNEQRREKAKEDRQLAMVKHREEKLDCAALVQQLYNQSDSGKGFQAALNEAGFTLAKGDRRGFVLVDEYGKIHSLSRQLKGQRAADINARLSGLENLPDAKTIAEEKQYFDRVKYEAEQQKIEEAAIEHEREKPKSERQWKKPGEKEKSEATGKPKQEVKPFGYYDSHLVKLDRQREWEQGAQRKRDDLNKQQGQFYKRAEQVEKIKSLEEKVAASTNILGRMSGKLQRLQDELEVQKLTLANADQRIAEQVGTLETKIQETNPEKISASVEKTPALNQKAEIQRQMEEIRERLNRSKDHVRDIGHDLER